MPAFTAIEDNSGESQGNIYFAKTNVHARRMAANEFCDGEFYGLRVTRDKRLDQYEADGRVPLFEMINRGWWCGCSECGCDIREEYYDDPDLEYEPDLRGKEPQGYFNRLGWCSAECEDEWQRKRYIETDILTKERGILRGRIMIHFNNVEWRGARPTDQQWGAALYDRGRVSWEKGVPSLESCRVLFRVPGSSKGCFGQVEYYKDQGGTGRRRLTVPRMDTEIYQAHAKKLLDSRIGTP